MSADATPGDELQLARARALFELAPFIQEVGYQLRDLGPGWVETELVVESRHLQHDGFIHAGVQGTMADHTAGGAAFTVLGPGKVALTVEYKLNLLRPASGDRLRCRAEVVKPGRSITVAESKVFDRHGDEEHLAATATVTLAIVDDPNA